MEEVIILMMVVREWLVPFNTGGDEIFVNCEIGLGIERLYYRPQKMTKHKAQCSKQKRALFVRKPKDSSLEK